MLHRKRKRRAHIQITRHCRARPLVGNRREDERRRRADDNSDVIGGGDVQGRSVLSDSAGGLAYPHTPVWELNDCQR